MQAFLRDFLGLCRFRRGPEDLPYSPLLLSVLLVACAVVVTVFETHLGEKPGAVAALLIGAVVAFGALFVALNLRGHRERFVQAATALAAVYLPFAVVIDLLAVRLPLKALYAAWEKHPEHPPVVTGGEALLALAVVVLAVWQLCVWIHILRRALDTSLPGGVLAYLILLLVKMFFTGLAIVVIGAH